VETATTKQRFIERLSASLPIESQRHPPASNEHLLERVFAVFDAMPLLSLEDPAYLARCSFSTPACLGLARWLAGPMLGHCGRRHIQDPGRC